jgi:regulator of protease activity HflC (stomatin/prohibitin superfamily)
LLFKRYFYYNSEIFLDEDVKKALQSLAEAKRINEAQIINFKAEVECSKLIKEVSMIINNEASFQMRYLNAVSEIINNGNNNTIIIKTSLEDKPEKEKQVDRRNEYI